MNGTEIFILGAVVIVISFLGFVFTVLEFRQVPDRRDAEIVEREK